MCRSRYDKENTSIDSTLSEAYSVTPMDGLPANTKHSQLASSINFCSHCGAEVEQKIPLGETLLRAVCPACQTIHYQNPKIVAGCIPEWEGQVLLCRRAIEPRLGFWTFPAGFMELGESTEEAAARETFEEAKAKVAIHSLHGIFSLPHVSQVYVVYRAVLQDLEYGPGEESLEVRLMSIESIPWEYLAFPVIRETVKRYVEDVRKTHVRVHFGTVPSQKHPVLDSSASVFSHGSSLDSSLSIHHPGE
jgi:ADP-ribose pyrophosphatase YjhB (NUDIX family)